MPAQLPLEPRQVGSEELEEHNLKLDGKYKEIEANEVMFEEYKTEDADLVVVAYGVVSRIVYSTIDMARADLARIERIGKRRRLLRFGMASFFSGLASLVGAVIGCPPHSQVLRP